VTDNIVRNEQAAGYEPVGHVFVTLLIYDYFGVQNAERDPVNAQISTTLRNMQEVAGGALPTEIFLCACLYFFLHLDIVLSLPLFTPAESSHA